MKKFKLLLLDANVVIYLFELGIWEKLIEKGDVHLSRAVAEREALYYVTDSDRHDIDLKPDIASGSITVVDVPLPEVMQFRSRFDPSYVERLDIGETESLVHLVNSSEQYLICSADSIVFKVLAQLRRSDQGISLEEVLNGVGLGRKLASMFSKPFRDRWTRIGAEEKIRDMGLKKSGPRDARA